MSWLSKRLRVPASESQMAMVLGLSSVIMSLMFWVILWQSSIIADQREVIRSLAHGLKFGS